jgi:predicted 3-demethylubiquinone-9 3-methyltransferase (glyoxalase superfamily)
MFKFTEAVSFYVHCKTQEEVDYLWDKLTADGGKESQCGWLKDKYGLSWQIIPDALGKLMDSPNPVKAQNVMKAMLQMHKIDIAGLQQAHDKA